MKKIRSLALILIICILISFLCPASFAEPDEPQTSEQPQQKTVEKNEDGLEVPSIGASYVVLADLDTGKVMYSRNSDSKAYPASLTKIMTVLLAVEAVEKGEANLQEKITAFDDCCRDLEDDSSTSDIVPGEVLTLEQLLYCAMVESANEACNIIAEYLGGTIEAFVDQMNERAKELGCTGTHFSNPHGLPNENHYTTANDMYIISKEASTHDLFMSICNAQSYTVPKTNKSEERKIYNSNALICGKGLYGGGYIYDYAEGMKTGHTSKAGYCLISTALKNDIHLICVVMGCGTETRDDGSTKFGNFADTITLYNWIFSNYKYYPICSVDDLVTEYEIKYAPADDSTVTVHPENDIAVLLPASQKSKDGEDGIEIEKKLLPYEGKLVAPIAAGDALGEIEYSVDGKIVGSTRLLASTSVDMSQAQFMKEQLHTTFGNLWVKIVFWLVILVILIYIVLVIRYRVLRQKHLKEKRRAELERAKQREKEATAKIFNRDAKMEYFNQSDFKKPSISRPATPVADVDKNKNQRDYFDEFFRNEGGKGNN